MTSNMLVTYSDSSSEEEVDKVNSDNFNFKRKQSATCETEPRKKKEKLPIPKGITTMFSQDKQHEDKQEEHGGRARTFAHERGNWATFVFAPVTDHLSELAATIIRILQKVADFKPSEDLHLSFSRTFVIRHHWIDSLYKSLKDNLQEADKVQSLFSSVGIYCNDEETRTFVGIRLESNVERLKHYVKQVDKSLQEFKLPLYYKDPSFHVSLAWALGNVKNRITALVQDELREAMESYFEDNVDEQCLKIEELQMKTGNKVFCIPLKK